jgi:hypothetical protein
MEQVICPKCGEPIASVRRLKEITGFCKEFWGRCTCGLKYHIILSMADTVVLSFPDTRQEIVC